MERAGESRRGVGESGVDGHADLCSLEVRSILRSCVRGRGRGGKYGGEAGICESEALQREEGAGFEEEAEVVVRRGWAREQRQEAPETRDQFQARPRFLDDRRPGAVQKHSVAGGI